MSADARQYTQKRQEGSPQWSRWGAQAARGSTLIVSYFVVVMLLGLAIPQTMRSMSNIQLATLFAGNRKTWQVAEAGLDDAIQYLRSSSATAKFGIGVSPCPAPDSTWDCLPMPTQPWRQLTGVGEYRLMAKNEGSPTTLLGLYTVRKRVRIISRLSPLGQVSTEEALVRVEQEFNGGIHVRGTMRLGQSAGFRGSTTFFSGAPDTLRLVDGSILEGTVIMGHAQGGLSENPPSGSDLCCDMSDPIRSTNPLPDEDAIVIGGTGRIMRDDGVAWAGPTLANVTGILMPADPKRPLWWPLPEAPSSLEPQASPNVCGSPPTIADVPQDAAQLFCPSDDPDPTSSCTYKIGQRRDDGSILYCLQSLKVRMGGSAKFKGESYNRIEVMTTTQAATSGSTVYIGQDAVVLPVYPNGSQFVLFSEPGVPKLTLNIPQGNPYKVELQPRGRSYGTINAPNVEVSIGQNSNVLLDAPLFAMTVTFQSNGVLEDTTGGDGLLKAPARVGMLGWRRCQSQSCNP